jgi:hypothetical protein
MKNKMKLISLATGICILLSATLALAKDFSADMINKTKAGISQGKIFVSKDKTRMETPESISITRMDKKVVWILMPKEKKYMEQAFDPAKAAATSEKVNGEIERKLLGQEVIDGRKTDKYQVTYTQNRKKETMLQWIASGLAMPVKMAAVDNSWTMEYKNIKTGKQADSLFEVPAGYEKFSVAMPSIKNMFKGLVR